MEDIPTTVGGNTMANRDPFEKTGTEKMREGAEEASRTAREQAENVRHRAEEMAERGKQKTDEGRVAAADKLQRAAGRLHETAEKIPGGERSTRAAHSVANTMERGAGYLRDHDVKDMMSDLESVVRRHPGPSLLTAAVVGFLVGRSLRNPND
jgi:ElaB/YqjD/DUF883 family membrane-anchored ribosome-binding protein